MPVLRPTNPVAYVAAIVAAEPLRRWSTHMRRDLWDGALDRHADADCRLPPQTSQVSRAPDGAVKSRLLLALLAIACCGCRTAPPIGGPLDRSLVAHWRFDEERGGSIVDSSGCGNGGQATGVRRLGRRTGRALSFEAPGSEVKIPASKSVSLGDAISIEAWIYPRDIEGSSRVIVAKNDEYALRIDNPGEGNRISFFVHVGQPGVAWEPRVSSPGPPMLNRWQHVVATWDGAESRLYLDGKLVGTRERLGKPNPNPYPVMIGNWEYPSCHGTHFGGFIDDVRLYSRALAAEEVEAHYSQTK